MTFPPIRSFLKKAEQYLLPAGLLLVLFSSQLGTLRHTAPTYDEYEFLSRGYLYLKTGNTDLKLRHPVLLDSLAAAPLLLLPDIQLPLEHPSLAEGNFHAYAQYFFWDLNRAAADQMIWLARLAPMALSLLLASAVFRWGYERFGFASGVLALVLVALDPNLLAHGRLVTPDVGQSTFFFLTVFAWWRYWQRPGRVRLLLAGLALGLAQTAGFPALVLYPILALITAAYGWQQARWSGLWRGALALGLASLLSLFTIWGVYRFQWGPVADLGVSLPAPYHWEELADLFRRLDRQDLAYLDGRVYRGGDAKFFIYALLLKTPLPTLLLIAVGAICLLRQRRWTQDLALWLFPLVYYGNALFSSLNIGYRHIIPILPFALVIAGSTTLLTKKVVWRPILGAAVCWLALASIAIAPYYLAYFNELAGGPLGGKRYLTVSDLDWGQDLPDLRNYLQEQEIGEIYLSYFGTTPPDHYQLQYRRLPAWPPRGVPGQEFYHPDYPLPGMHVISAANLMGARFEENPATFAWFWDREPLTTIGYSLYLFEVPLLLNATTPPVNVVLSNTRLADIPADFIRDTLQTNDLRPRWVDAQQALILPAGHTLLLLAEPVHPALTKQVLAQASAVELTLVNGRSQLAYLKDGTALADQLLSAVANSVWVENQSPEPAPWQTPVQMQSILTFMGYQWLTDELMPAGQLELLTLWRVDAPTVLPWTSFAHLLAPDNQIVAQYDNWGVASSYWQKGDLIAQIHTIVLPETLPAELGWFAVGLYRTDTLDRLPVAQGAGDRLLIPLPEASHD